MEGKEPIKVRLSTVILLFIIFILILFIVFMFFYNRNTNTNLQSNDISASNTSRNIETNTATSAENATLKTTDLDINSNQIQILYKYIMDANDNQEELVYRTNKVTEKDLNNQLKLITVFQNLNENQADETKTAKDKYGNSSVHKYYNKSTVENLAKTIFGSDVTITHEPTMIGMGEDIDYKDDKYDVYDYEGGGRTEWEDSTSKLIKAEQVGDEIYIYDKYVHLFEVENIVNGVNNAGSYDIYSASDKAVKLSSKVDFDKNNLYGDDKINKIEKFLNQELTTFKHTFKKASDGSYYWYSTEPTK